MTAMLDDAKPDAPPTRAVLAPGRVMTGAGAPPEHDEPRIVISFLSECIRRQGEAGFISVDWTEYACPGCGGIGRKVSRSRVAFLCGAERVGADDAPLSKPCRRARGDASR